MIKQKKRFTKKILFIILACFVVLALILLVLEKTNVTHFITKDSSTVNAPTSAFDSSTPAQKEQDAATNAATKQQVGEKNNGQPQETTPIGTSKNIELSAKQESNNTVTIFTKLFGYSSGTCTLSITNGASQNSQSAQVLYSPEYSTCAGFSIPVSALGAGDWSINLKVDSNGTSDAKSLIFKVQ